ncbi:MAG: Fe-S cluster protein [Desulfobacteraceae bacterium]|nr:Fe-S cluster protein [Desulfobacteraceae bacterium]
MLLNRYRIEMFRPACNASFQSLNCHAQLEEDIGEVIPYLNAVLGGTGFTREPPSVMFRVHGRLIAVHPRKIAINALNDAEEAEKILRWLQQEINEAWERREAITPSYAAAPRPQPMAVVKLLPKTNCGECGQATCLLFSTLVVQGVLGAEGCPRISRGNRERMEEYLARFPRIDY